MAWIEVTPAYGRDYKNQKEVKEAWNADKDFRETSTARYINKTQAVELGLSVNVRYANDMKIVTVTK